MTAKDNILKFLKWTKGALIMRTKFLPFLLAVLMLFSACNSKSDAAPESEQPGSKTDSKTSSGSSVNHNPNVPNGYRLAEDGEEPDAYINEDGSIVSDPYNDDGSIGPDLWGVIAESSFSDYGSDDDISDDWEGPGYMDNDGDGIITGREAGLKYFEYGGMDPDRQAYRLSCITQGINLSTPSQTKGSFPEIYNRVMRNIYDYYGNDCAISGKVNFIERTGYSTVMIVEIPLLTDTLYVIADVNTDIGVGKGDTITIFGTYEGPATYTETNEYGTETEKDTFRVGIMDYYLGDSMAEAKSEFLPGAPSLTEEEKSYWYRTYDSGFALTDNGVILRDGTLATYTVSQYAYDPEIGAYTLYFRYDDLADSYPENTYTILHLTYAHPHFFMESDETQALYNATYQTDHVSTDYPTRTHTTLDVYRWNVLDAY